MREPRELLDDQERIYQFYPLKMMDDDIVWVGAGMKQVLLRTVGRESSNEQEVTLPYWIADDGERIVVASQAGNITDPACSLDLSDRDQNREVSIETQTAEFWAKPRVLEGAERERTEFTADRPCYLNYRSRYERQSPLVKLVEIRPA